MQQLKKKESKFAILYKNLLADINRLSSDFTFSFGGHDYCENHVCTFDIIWEF